MQISDLSFRRHVLVQALIITDFLLSLSKEEREKRTNINVSNKSVIYPDQLNEENVRTLSDVISLAHILTLLLDEVGYRHEKGNIRLSQARK